MKKIYKNTFNSLFVCALFALSSQLSAQISFTNSNNLLNSTDWHSGVAVGVVDMNNDQLNDILRLHESNILTIEYQVEGDTFTPYMYGSIAANNQWTMAAGDANNDGFNDVIAGDVNLTKIIMANATGTDFTHEDLPGPPFFAQGSNFADINNDGFLDIFVCDDNAESRIFGNNGDGTFSEADSWIDMTTTPASDNSGNYGSIWTDFDNDGDIDLYIAKCRQGVTNSADPRRINALFVNDGSNNYTERAEEFGLKIGWQSWTSDFNDIDNDGDMDVFLTNHDFVNQLLENDGAGHFRDISTNQNIGIGGTNFPLQGVMRDFDNDGFVDILISGGTSHLYRNNGDKTFTEITGIFDDEEMHSYALGDLNNDGFVDIYASYGTGYVTPTDVDDVIWLNDTNDNNWLGVNLIGTTSNRNAVGARIEIYGDWGIQVREVRAGESYGIMNSLQQNFGLGEATSIDHIVVKWPSGSIDVIENPTINEYLTITETSCEPFSIEISPDGGTILCEGESLNISAPAGYNYIWSTGAESSSISVDQAGNFNVVVQDMNTGCYGISQNIFVEYEPDETPSLAIDGDLEFCQGGTVMLSASEASAYTWSDGSTGQSLEVSESGTYFVTTQGVCAEFSSDTVEVNVLPAPAPEAEDVEITAPGPATLMATGENPQWYDAEVGGTLLGEGNTLEIPFVDVPTTYWVEDIIEHGTGPSNVGMLDHMGNDYSGSQWNGGIEFDALSPFTIETVKVYTDTEAERRIELRDANGTVVESLLVNIPVTGEEGLVIEVGIEVPVGNGHVLTTDAAQNNAVLGYNSPRLKRSSSGTDYPSYEVEGVVDFVGPTIGSSSRYYYFYDWEIQPESTFCTSDRVSASVDLVSSTFDIASSPEVSIFPNPTDGLINLQLDFDQNTEVQLVVTDLAGKTVYRDDLGSIAGEYSKSLHLDNLAKGIYLVRVETETNTYFGKIAIQ